MSIPVHHRRTMVGGVDVFYREAGPAEAPVLLLPHGYPCSSYKFRDYMRHLGEDWRLLAPDFPGSGYSATPEAFAYDFDGFASFLEDFAETLGVDHFALYLHDFGSQIGLRLAIRDPRRIAALIIQNGDIYEDVLGPKYAGLEDIWRMERPKGLSKLRESISKDHFRDEFLNDVPPELAQRIPPDPLGVALAPDDGAAPGSPRASSTTSRTILRGFLAIRPICESTRHRR
jgi:pimeloyl-ACP methyl ester carboxylesterase